MRAKALTIGTVVILALTVAGELVSALSEHLVASATVSQVALSGGAVEARVKAGSNPVDLHAVAGLLEADRPVYVLVDFNLPMVLTTPLGAKGLYDHLAATLLRGGWTSAITRVTTSDLSQIVTSNPQSILVIGTGVIPPQLAGATGDFAPLRRYLNEGGELVFAGEGLFFWTLGSVGLEAAGWQAEHVVLGDHLVYTGAEPPPATELGTGASAGAQAIGTEYPLVGRGAVLAALQRLGGWDLGWDSVEGAGPVRTSLAVVPVGLGRLVLFGAGLYQEIEIVADDVARVLLSGSDVGPPVGTITGRVAAGISVRLRLDLPSRISQHDFRLMIFDELDFRDFHRTVRIHG